MTVFDFLPVLFKTEKELEIKKKLEEQETLHIHLLRKNKKKYRSFISLDCCHCNYPTKILVSKRPPNQGRVYKSCVFYPS